MNKQSIYLIVVVLAIAGLIIGGVVFWKKKPVTGGNTNQTSFMFKNAVGMKAPDFTLQDMSGNMVALSSLMGKNVVLFFNEGLMCYPACLDQVAALNQEPKLNNDNTVAFSVVVDSPDNWIKAQKELPYLTGAKVLFDPDATISKAYDTLKLASSMHKGFYPGHTYYIIDKEGTIRFAYDDPYMGNRNSIMISEVEKLK